MQCPWIFALAILGLASSLIFQENGTEIDKNMYVPTFTTHIACCSEVCTCFYYSNFMYISYYIPTSSKIYTLSAVLRYVPGPTAYC